VDEADVVSDVLRAVRLTAEVFGRFELGAPWSMRVPADQNHLSFYVIARGGAWLELEGSPHVALSAGDVVLLPHGATHVLRDPSRAATADYTVREGGCPRPTATEPVRFGGDGPVTAFVAGAFRFGASARSVLLETLPPVLHVAAGDASMNAQVSATIQLILAESAAPGLGGTLLSARLAEILLVQALRIHATHVDRRPGAEHKRGLCALADPSIGASLRLMHAQPAEAWTVERLARAVGLSRSAFSARFTELVGESPLQYLTRWRMTEAAELLREQDDSVPSIAERVGYGNAAAFMKAFTRVQGVGPGAYRRAHRAP
jgi:AraC-like DNA-binding protein